MAEKLTFLENNKNVTNTLASEHLSSGVKPILFCVGTPKDFKEYSGLVGKIYRPGADDTIENVDYSEGDREVLVKNGFKNPEEESYVISPISSKDKISLQYRNCTGVVVSGKDKDSGEYISFMTHQWPEFFLSENDPDFEMFLSDLKERTDEMRDRCVPGTVDAVIFGGNYAYGDEEADRWDDEQTNKTFREDYFESVQLLVSEISEILGFEPPIITGPQISHTEGYDEDVLFDNKERRLYIVKPEVGDSSTESYLVGNLKEQEVKWVADILAKKKAKIEEVAETKKCLLKKDDKKKETIYKRIKKLFE